jgi:hypothetical protein
MRRKTTRRFRYLVSIEGSLKTARRMGQHKTDKKDYRTLCVKEISGTLEEVPYEKDTNKDTLRTGTIRNIGRGTVRKDTNKDTLRTRTSKNIGRGTIRKGYQQGHSAYKNYQEHWKRYRTKRIPTRTLCIQELAGTLEEVPYEKDTYKDTLYTRTSRNIGRGTVRKGYQQGHSAYKN